jgi:putative FmdB family regulatory protein
MGSFSFVFAGVAEMPIYAYRCEACGFEKDVLQKLSDAPLTQCPSCGQPSFAKQVTAAGFQLKGSGWYVTDFRGGSSASSAAGSTAGPTAAPTAVSNEAQSASSSSATAPSTDAS